MFSEVKTTLIRVLTDGFLFIFMFKRCKGHYNKHGKRINLSELNQLM